MRPKAAGWAIQRNRVTGTGTTSKTVEIRSSTRPFDAIEPCLQADDADDGKDEGAQKGRQRILRHTRSAGQADKGRTKPYFPGDRWSSHPIRALEIMGVPRLLSPPARPGLKMIVAPPPRVPAASDAIKCRRPAIIYPAVHTQGTDIRLKGLCAMGGSPMARRARSRGNRSRLYRCIAPTNRCKACESNSYRGQRW